MKLLRGTGSAIGTIGNAMEIPFEYLDATMRQGYGAQGEVGKLTKTLQTKGLGAAASQYGLYSKPQLQFYATHGDPITRSFATTMLNHPVLAGAADFVSEFANPSNLLIPAGASALGAIAKRTPILAPALEKAGQAAAAAFDRFNPLKVAGGDEARMIGWQSQAAAAEARKANEAIGESIFGNPGKMGLGGTTKDEQFEILRRATGGAPKTPLESSGLSDEDLTQRANAFRRVVDEADVAQKQRGMLHQAHENYFNMRGAYDVPETAAQVAGMGKPRGVAGNLRWRAPTTHEKAFHTFDEVLEAVAKGQVKLKDDFSPFAQLVSHLNRVSGNVALDDFIENLAKTDAAKEVEFAGKTGVEALDAAKLAAQKQARRIAAVRAAEEVGRQFGLDPTKTRAAIAGRFGDADKIGARLSELQRMSPTVERRVMRAASGTASARPSWAFTARQVKGVRGQLSERATDLAQRLADPNRKVATAYRDLRDKMVHDLMSEGDASSLWSKMRNKLTPEGYLQVKSIPGLSGLDRLKYTDLKPEVVKYLTDAGAATRDAEGVGSWLDRFNSLFRIGILTNPLIHPGYNLLWAYLGSGGDAKRLATIFRDNPALDAEAAKFGAHAPLGMYTFGGNVNRLVQTAGEAAKEGPIAAADWATSRMAAMNRKLVFDTLERRMATELWGSYVARGIDKAKAGEMVRKAFGDYGNLTNWERNISRMFFFYPWTKAVIPFWLRTMVHAPQWVNAPQQAITTHNELAGDPNLGKELPFTVFTGLDAQGNPQYQALPMPQKRIEDVLEMALPRVGGQVQPRAGVAERLQPLLGMAQYHLTPGLNVAAGVLEQQFKEPQEPGVTPAPNVVYDRYAPLSTQLAQIATYAAKNAIPFTGLVQGIAHGVGEAAGGHGGVVRALSNLAGGWQYGEASPLQKRALSRAFDEFQHAYNASRKIPDAGERTQKQTLLYELFRRRADAIIKAKPQAQSPTGAAPGAGGFVWNPTQ